MPPAGLATKISHASPHQTVRLFVSRLPSRPGSFTTSPEPPTWSTAHVNGLPTLRTRPASPTTTTSATAPTSAAHDPAAAAGDEPRHRHLRDEDEHDDGSADGERTEDRAVGDAVGTGAAVLDECRAGERPPGDDQCRGQRERAEQAGLDPVLRLPEHEGDHDESCDEAGARLRQQKHEPGGVEEQGARGPGEAAAGAAERGDEPETEAEGGIGEERERIPVADRALQPGDPARIVRAEGRDRLAEERPDEDDAERGGQEQRQRAQRARRVRRPAASPTTPNASRTIPFASASQERSPAIDHHTLRPIQATSPIAAAAAATP